ncbi:unnamed protein product [Urochloa humidicola]
MLMLPRKKNRREAETKRKGRLFRRVKRHRSGGAEEELCNPVLDSIPSILAGDRASSLGVGETRDPSVPQRPPGLEQFPLSPSGKKHLP